MQIPENIIATGPDVAGTLADEAPRQPRPWLAAVMSFFVPGLGHLYAGRGRRGLLWMAGCWVLGVLGAAILMRTWPFAVRAALFAVVAACTNAGIVWDAFRSARTATPRRKWYTRWYWLAGYAAAMLLVTQPLVRAFTTRHVASSYTIPAASMQPALLPGDYVMAGPRGSGPVTRGMVAVVRERDGLDHVMRVIGMPGDTLEMRERMLYVNGRRRAEPYAVTNLAADVPLPAPEWQRPFLLRTPGDTAPYAPTPDTWGPLRVPAGSYFVMGDNRPASMDSRYIGFVPDAHVMGRIAWIYFSRDPETGAFRWDRIGKDVQ
ncbi:MAG TPA: signal peptidase I [Longimicrobiaceae bacterium]|jgi:signal peptidase I|nr:signal peptidase I [Longimicrobiaceae bacterium]